MTSTAECWLRILRNEVWNLLYHFLGGQQPAVRSWQGQEKVNRKHFSYLSSKARSLAWAAGGVQLELLVELVSNEKYTLCSARGDPRIDTQVRWCLPKSSEPRVRAAPPTASSKRWQQILLSKFSSQQETLGSVYCYCEEVIATKEVPWTVMLLPIEKVSSPHPLVNITHILKIRNKYTGGIFLNSLKESLLW